MLTVEGAGVVAALMLVTCYDGPTSREAIRCDYDDCKSMGLMLHDLYEGA